MCGISVILSWKNPSVLKEIKEMTNTIRHRGPDDEGYAFFPTQDSSPLIFGGSDSPSEVFQSSINYTPEKLFSKDIETSPYHLAFGHRRLSILDLSESGHQPMCDQTGRYWITYNGEVYNYIEIREELKSMGHRFHTNTDTEVIICAYQEWGEDFLHKLNGMFAFVLYDSQQKSLIAARDRSGVKPLYYWKSPEGFIAIASEIKQFIHLPGWAPKVNGQAAYDFLNWGLTNNSAETNFLGVNQIYAGEVMTLILAPHSPPTINIKKWYQLPISEFRGSFAEAGEQFAHLLGDSVRLRTRADVSIGSCLSGGLDSSSIVCLVNSLLQEQKVSHPQMTFSACSHHKRFDEREFIEEVVSKTNVKSHYTFPEFDNLLIDLDQIIWHQDEPFGTTSIYAQWEVFKLVKSNGIKVMLDGQGSDEQLGGYEGFFSTRLADLVRSYRLYTFWNESRKFKEIHGVEYSFKLLLNQLLPDWIRQPLRRLARKPAITAPWLNTQLLGATLRDPHNIDIPLKSVFQKKCYIQTTRTSLPMLLHFEDRDSMAHSIEARTPFLDYRLLEFIQGLPPDYKMFDAETKRVLRHGLNGILPDKIRNRTCKLGFATPEEIWVKEQYPDLFRKLLAESYDQCQGILNEKALKYGEDIISGKTPYDSLLWRMIIYGKWMKHFKLAI